MTEKRKPTYDLRAFKAAFASVDDLHVTGTAVRSAAALGFDRAAIVATLQTMERPHFYKSMPPMPITGSGRTFIMCPRPWARSTSSSPLTR